MAATQPAVAADRAPYEFTVRAILTGIVLGALLTPCNVYSGLKIGWSFNMSIAAGLLAAALWGLAQRFARARPWALLENNINQTTASSSASIISGGLVAPIPALTLLTGRTFDWHVLAFWVFAVSILGVVVAAALRVQMIEREKLPFPAGVATAETIRQIHARGREATRRLRLLLGGALVSAAVKLVVELAAGAVRWAPPVALPALGATRVAPSATNLGFALDPSLLMLGFGAIIGLRVGVSLLLGAIVAWGILAPVVLARGWTEPGAADVAWFGPLVEWLLWPGVTLIVVSSLVSFAISVGRLVWRKAGAALSPGPARGPYVLVLGVVSALVAFAAWSIFDLPVWISLLAVALSFVLAIVAARVTGETGVTPIGALGKITQLTYGVVTPGDVASNLMTANVTGGAAGQCADLMHDLKTGQIVGATARLQILAQCFGVLVGSLVGSLIYLVLIPDPAGMLITPDWPAPAVATWKAVAEVLSRGLGAIPDGASWAMAIAAALGIVMAIAERSLPARAARFFPSAPAIGLAFVLPAWNAISFFLGALFAALAVRYISGWTRERGITLAAGLVAGESLMGVGLAFGDLLG